MITQLLQPSLTSVTIVFNSYLKVSLYWSIFLSITILILLLQKTDAEKSLTAPVAMAEFIDASLLNANAPSIVLDQYVYDAMRSNTVGNWAQQKDKRF